MNYLSQYYKNLSEQMQEKIKNLEYLLKEQEMKYIYTKTQAQIDLENDAMNPRGGKSNRKKIYPGSFQDITSRMQKDNTSILR